MKRQRAEHGRAKGGVEAKEVDAASSLTGDRFACWASLLRSPKSNTEEGCAQKHARQILMRVLCTQSSDRGRMAACHLVNELRRQVLTNVARHRGCITSMLWANNAPENFRDDQDVEKERAAAQINIAVRSYYEALAPLTLQNRTSPPIDSALCHPASIDVVRDCGPQPETLLSGIHSAPEASRSAESADPKPLKEAATSSVSVAGRILSSSLSASSSSARSSSTAEQYGVLYARACKWAPWAFTDRYCYQGALVSVERAWLAELDGVEEALGSSERGGRTCLFFSLPQDVVRLALDFVSLRDLACLARVCRSALDYMYARGASHLRHVDVDAWQNSVWRHDTLCNLRAATVTCPKITSDKYGTHRDNQLKALNRKKMFLRVVRLVTTRPRSHAPCWLYFRTCARKTRRKPFHTGEDSEEEDGDEAERELGDEWGDESEDESEISDSQDDSETDDADEKDCGDEGRDDLESGISSDGGEAEQEAKGSIQGVVAVPIADCIAPAKSLELKGPTGGVASATRRNKVPRVTVDMWWCIEKEMNSSVPYPQPEKTISRAMIRYLAEHSRIRAKWMVHAFKLKALRNTRGALASTWRTITHIEWCLSHSDFDEHLFLCASMRPQAWLMLLPPWLESYRVAHGMQYVSRMYARDPSAMNARRTCIRLRHCTREEWSRPHALVTRDFCDALSRRMCAQTSWIVHKDEKGASLASVSRSGVYMPNVQTSDSH